MAKRKGKGRRAVQMELDIVLVTNMEDDIFTLTQHCRDRGDAENNFDE
jgi:hypothetical protein